MNTQLIDRFGRQVRYLRLSVTDRCNLRCTYCMAEDMTFLPKARVLTFEEILQISTAFVDLGVEKIRLTGGEPLVRSGIIELSTRLKRLDGLKELVMTTNGVLLDKFARPLKEAGMDRLNISIDSLQEERFNRLTRFGDLKTVLRGIDAAANARFKKIKLNAVILNGVNDDEVVPLTEFAIEHGFDISFIEEMPLGEISSHIRAETQHQSANIREQLETRFRLLDEVKKDPNAGPSRYLKIDGTDSKVGFISPMSHNFCESCNRVRLTAEGLLLLCLGNEHSADLKKVVRANPGNDDVLREAILNALEIKPQRHYFDPNDITIMRHMSATGG